MLSVHPSPVSRDARALLAPLLDRDGRGRELQVSVVGEFSHAGRSHEIPKIRIAGAYAGHDPIRLALFAGIHGDEPAGCAALVEFAKTLAADPARAAGYELHIYPVLNPAGYEKDTRFNHAGKDLNQSVSKFRGNHSPDCEVDWEKLSEFLEGCHSPENGPWGIKQAEAHRSEWMKPREV